MSCCECLGALLMVVYRREFFILLGVLTSRVFNLADWLQQPSHVFLPPASLNTEQMVETVVLDVFTTQRQTHTQMGQAAANSSNLSESLQLHFVLAEKQFHLLQLVFQNKIVLQQHEVELQHEDEEHVRYRGEQLCSGGWGGLPGASSASLLSRLCCVAMWRNTYSSVVGWWVPQLSLTEDTHHTLLKSHTGLNTAARARTLSPEMWLHRKTHLEMLLPCVSPPGTSSTSSSSCRGGFTS